MSHPLVSELAQRLGKSEEEVLQFFQILWQVMPPSPETQPYFFRYLDERFLRLEDRYTTLRQEMHQQIEGLRKEMQQQVEGLRKEMQLQVEGLRKEMQQQVEGLRKEMQQGDANLMQQIEGLRQEMHQQIEGLRREMQHNDTLLRQEIEALRRHVERVEKWLFALTVPVLISTLGILVSLLKP
ncbi:MAG: hypothetical protein ACK4I8_09395 [Armatimonadota bacterium]